MIYPGGEIEFVTKLIQESSLDHNRSMIKWFSSMFGKLASLNVIVCILKKMGCTNYAVTEFVQGQRTRRWCVAWTWTGLRPSLAIARGTDAIEKKYLPFPTELDISVIGQSRDIGQAIEEALGKLEGLEWRWIEATTSGVGRSKNGDVWSRRARRRLQKLAADHDSMDIDKDRSKNEDTDDETDVDDKDLFVFRIAIEHATNKAIDGHTKDADLDIHIRWLQGHDSTVFESFHGWLKRKLHH